MAMFGAMIFVLVGISLVTDSRGTNTLKNEDTETSDVDNVRMGRNLLGERNRRSPQMPIPIPELPQNIPTPEVPQNLPIPQFPGRRRRSPQLPIQLPKDVPLPSLPTSVGRKRRSPEEGQKKVHEAVRVLIGNVY